MSIAYESKGLRVRLLDAYACFETVVFEALVDVAAIAGGGTATIIVDIVLDPGTAWPPRVSLRANIDALGAVTESDEANNDQSGPDVVIRFLPEVIETTADRVTFDGLGQTALLDTNLRDRHGRRLSGGTPTCTASDERVPPATP